MPLTKIGTIGIDDNAITATQIATDAVDSAEIAADAVTASEIAADAVTTVEILDANVTLAKIASQAANTVLVRDASSSGVVSAKAVATTEILIGDGTGFTAAALSGDTTMTNAGAVTIADNAVSIAKMAGLTRGSIIIGDASGDPSALATGTTGKFLTTDGSDLSWGAVTALPTQTSKAGYALVTDGTDASWAEGPNRNVLINGGMSVSQRIGTTLTTIAGDNYIYGLDRWRFYLGTQSGHKDQQVTDAPPGFGNSLKFTVATGEAVASGTKNTFSQPVEGLNWARFGFGAATASSITLSFWVKCSLTGDFGVHIKNSALDRVYVQSYTISSADTWEKKSITIAGDTSGTWLTTNGVGGYVGWDMGSGSARRGTAGAWGTSDIDGVTGDVQIMATSAATWQISGVQVEAGSTETTFEFKHFSQEVAACQRYYEKSYNQTTDPGTSGVQAGLQYSTNNAVVLTQSPGAVFKVTKRSNPTIVMYNAVTGTSGEVYRASDASTQTVTVSHIGEAAIGYLNVPSNNNGYLYHYTADSEL